MFAVKEAVPTVSLFHRETEDLPEHGEGGQGERQGPRDRNNSSSSIQTLQQPLEDIIDKMPPGWFHRRLVLVCGLGYTANSMAVSLLSFVSVCASIDWGLNDNQNASLIR
jgi:hypothetical protein